MVKEKTVYTCTECGGTNPKWLGKCPHCNAWNTLEEGRADLAVHSLKDVPMDLPEGFVLGRDYPKPMVEHDKARQATLDRYGILKGDGSKPAGTKPAGPRT